MPLVTCSRDAEKSNFFSFYVDALSIQLVRCRSGALVGCRQVVLTWSVPPGDGPLTQHSPAVSRAANPFSVRRAPCLFNYLILSPNLTNLSLFLAQVEMRGFEPLASAVQGRRSPN